MPTTIGACVDALYKLREQRLKVEKQAEAIKEQETALRGHILQNFAATDVEGAKGKLATAGITRKTVASVQDWEKFYAYIKKQGAFDLLQRRVNDAAYRERLDAHKAVPGVEPLVVTGLSLTKR